MSALVDDLAVVLVPETQDHMVVAESLLAALEDLDPHASVGIGGLRRGVRGIRISYFEAGAALHAGSGISDFAAGTITGLLLGQSDAPVRDMAVSLLRPLVSYDASKHGELLTTLRTFLDQRCSPGATADILAVHRNGLKYRLDLIMELTGRDLSRFDHCVELWLALRALDQPE
jgi:purine catabolism regulator